MAYDEKLTIPLREAQKKVTDICNAMSTKELIPYALLTLNKLHPTQLKLARRYTLHDLARIELMYQHFFGVRQPRKTRGDDQAIT